MPNRLVPNRLGAELTWCRIVQQRTPSHMYYIACGPLFLYPLTLKYSPLVNPFYIFSNISDPVKRAYTEAELFESLLNVRTFTGKLV